MKNQQLVSDMAEYVNLVSAQIIEHNNSMAAKMGLTPVEFKCLLLFKEKPTLSIKELGKGLRLSSGRITHLISALENKNYVTKRTDVIDKRNVIVHLTENSKSHLRNYIESQKNLFRKMLEQHEAHEQNQIIATLKELTEILKKD